MRNDRPRGTSVTVRNNDYVKALRTFNRKIQESGLIKELRERTAYEKPTTERKKKKAQARKRWCRTVDKMIQDGLWHPDRRY